MNTALYHAVIDAEYSVADAHRRIADITYRLGRASDERDAFREKLDELHSMNASRKEMVANLNISYSDSLLARPWYKRFILTEKENGFVSEIRLHMKEIAEADIGIERYAGWVSAKEREITCTENILSQWQEKLRVSELDAHGYRTGYLEPAFAY